MGKGAGRGGARACPDGHACNTCCPDGGCCGCGNTKWTFLDINQPRGCSDIVVALLFALFVIGVAVIAGWAGERGNPDILIYGTDSWGNVCGQGNPDLLPGNPYTGLDLSDYTHEYRTLQYGGRKLCVKQCPTIYTSCSANPAACASSGVCINFPGSPYAGIDGNISCPTYMYDSEAQGLSERCEPIGNPSTNDPQAFGQHELYAASVDAELGFQELVSNFYAARWPILAMCFLAAACSFLFIGLMRCCTLIIVYFVMGLSVIATWMLAGTLWYYGAEAGEQIKDESEGQRTDSEMNNYYLIMISAGLVTLIAMLYLCMLCAMRHRIYKAVGILKEAAVAFLSMPTVFCCPILTWALVSSWVAIFLVIGMFVATSAEVTENPVTTYAEYNNPEKLWAVWVYMVIALFWVTQFFIAAMEFCIGSCIVIWYLSRTSPVGIPLKTSIWRLLRYHFGSVAFGALIVTIIQLIRAVFEYLDHKYKREMDRSCCVRFFVNCMRCCLRCLEHCIRFINKNAYIEVAIWGDGFIPSACRALNLLLEHAALVSIVNGIAWFLVEIFKLAVCLSIGFISYLWLRSSAYDEEVNMYGFVVAFIILVSYLIVGSFTGMYEIGAEAILICLCEDHKRSPRGAYYASARLQRFEFGHQRIGQPVDPSKNPYLVSNSSSKI